MYRRNFTKGRFQGRPGKQGGHFRKKGNFRASTFNIASFINQTPRQEEKHFTPKQLFENFEIHSILKNNITKKGYKIPTPIQDEAIPHILSGSDIVGIANTGTGKTAAFLIPLINKVLANPKEKVIIVVPTRELALQIDEELRGFVSGLKIFSVCCVGGASIGQQISSLRYYNNFIIGTPGRLKDLIQRKFINLSNFNTIVLDEADRMLDMGFINDMKFMMSFMPKDRHTLFFSATLSKDVEGLISAFLNKPVMISVKENDTPQNVDQDVIRLGRDDNKVDVLHDLLVKPEFSKVLIFGKTKHGVEKLSVLLSRKGFSVESIHGNKNHSKRQKALKMFKENKIQALVATDVAARGLDINGVSHVINFDMPATHEDYIHRIGRTGRGDQKGKALTFIEHTSLRNGAKKY